MNDPLQPLIDLKNKLIAENVLFFAVKETQVRIAERAFDQGKLSDGTDVPYKEDYEVYAYTPPSPRAVSKKGKPYSKWKRPPANPKGSARSIKGGYYDSWLKYKDAMGRGPLELTGRLRKDFLSSTTLVQSGPFVVEVVLRGENAAKYSGLADTKGDFLTPSDEEVAYFAERLTDLSTQ
jgi:hypothetical protein